MIPPNPNRDGEDSARALRWSVYLLLIAVSLGQVTARLMAVNSVDRQAVDAYRINQGLDKIRQSPEAKKAKPAELEKLIADRRAVLQKNLQSERPFLSGNDRSRWLTVRALVEDHTYAIDQIVCDPEQARVWDTIDMVKHLGRDQQPHLYSSKPPLLATILAGPYWLIYRTTGMTLRGQPYVVGRIMLLLTNVIPLGIYFLLLAAMLERYGATNWGRLTVLTAATFGTFLTTFSIVLNNHVLAAFASTAAVYAGLRIWYDGCTSLRYFAIAGFFAALTAALELPALSFCVLLGAALAYRFLRPTLVAFLPAALLVGAAFVGTDYAAYGTLAPPYAFRSEGKDWQTGNWYAFTYKVGDSVKKSYWSSDPESMARRSVVDRGEESPAVYALHSLVGHHGIFSLTPIWLLSVLGILMAVCRRDATVEREDGAQGFKGAGGSGGQGSSLRALGLFAIVLSVVCVGFYLIQGRENRNYGGTASGLRWVFWLAPLWLLAMLPAADWTAGGRLRRGVVAVLLFFSAFAASYPIWNPWTHPWIAQWMAYLGWIKL